MAPGPEEAARATSRGFNTKLFPAVEECNRYCKVLGCWWLLVGASLLGSFEHSEASRAVRALSSESSALRLGRHSRLLPGLGRILAMPDCWTSCFDPFFVYINAA